MELTTSAHNTFNVAKKSEQPSLCKADISSIFKILEIQKWGKVTDV